MKIAILILLFVFFCACSKQSPVAPVGLADTLYISTPVSGAPLASTELSCYCVANATGFTIRLDSASFDTTGKALTGQIKLHYKSVMSRDTVTTVTDYFYYYNFYQVYYGSYYGTPAFYVSVATTEKRDGNQFMATIYYYNK